MAAVLALAAALGAVLGSFVGAVAARVPDGRSLTARSACGACSHRLGPAELVPVVSWCALRGRCRHCRAPIGVRDLAVEAVTAAVWVALTARLGPVDPYLPAALTGGSGLVALGLVDLERRLLPKRILYPTLAATAVALTAAAAGTGQWGRLAAAAVSAAVLVAVMWAVHAARPGHLGFGDVRLAGLIGLLVGPYGAGGVDLAVLAACGAGLAVAAIGGLTGLSGTATRWPFGTYLAGGALAALLVAGQATTVVL